MHEPYVQGIVYTINYLNHMSYIMRWDMSQSVIKLHCSKNNSRAESQFNVCSLQFSFYLSAAFPTIMVLFIAITFWRSLQWACQCKYVLPELSHYSQSIQNKQMVISFLFHRSLPIRWSEQTIQTNFSHPIFTSVILNQRCSIQIQIYGKCIILPW